jgi:hypothetical protein
MNQVQLRWLTSAHRELRLAQPQLKLLTYYSRYTPLRNLRSDPEKALCESRIHLIVIRYYWGQTARTHVSIRVVDTATLTQQKYARLNLASRSTQSQS